MKIFGTLYDKTLSWSKHRFAGYWLFFVSFIESIIFPIPPDVMLIPMSIAQPQKAAKYAIYTAAASVMGGAIGYGIGYFFYDMAQQFVTDLGYHAAWEQAILMFQEWGIVIIFIAAFSPIPYKVFTVCAGTLQMAFIPFMLTSFVGRLLRFILVAKLAAWGGNKFETQLKKYIEYIGWLIIILAIVAYLILKFT